eukprot:3294701-Pleurochrysis_carterae.AAC.2
MDGYSEAKSSVATGSYSHKHAHSTQIGRAAAAAHARGGVLARADGCVPSPRRALLQNLKGVVRVAHRVEALDWLDDGRALELVALRTLERDANGTHSTPRTQRRLLQSALPLLPSSVISSLLHAISNVQVGTLPVLSRSNSPSVLPVHTLPGVHPTATCAGPFLSRAASSRRTLWAETGSSSPSVRALR